jgi:archaellin
MQARHILTAAVTAVALLVTAGCAVQRKQETVGVYVDDTSIMI